MDAQYYRIDFVKVVIDEMIRESGGEVKNTTPKDNETMMKELFDGK